MFITRKVIFVMLAVSFVTLLAYARLSQENQNQVSLKYQYTSNVELLDIRALLRCVSTNLNGSQSEIFDYPIETEWLLEPLETTAFSELKIAFKKTSATKSDWWRVLKDCSYHIEFLVDDFQGLASRGGISNFRIPLKMDLKEKKDQVLVECYPQGCHATYDLFQSKLAIDK